MIETIKNLANILFFLVASIITVLTFLHARKTIFDPIKTEIFKLQLQAFEEILSFFQDKSEYDFLETFDFHQISELNALQMADDYVATFFEEEFALIKETRKELYKNFVGGIVSIKYAKKNLISVDKKNPILEKNIQKQKVKLNETKIQKWRQYEKGSVGFTKDYEDNLNKVRKITSSPILPEELKAHLNEFVKTVQKNLEILGVSITQCSKDMPKHFPTYSSLKEFNTAWIHNHYNHNRKPFELECNKILNFINDYLKINNISPRH